MNFIGYSERAESNQTFKAFSPSLNGPLPEDFSIVSEAEFDQALSLANDALEALQDQSACGRAGFLRTVAEEIMMAGDFLISRCSMETGLTKERIVQERARTCAQLNYFADLLVDGWYVDARIDTAEPSRLPLSKPDIRRMLVPIGPVAVFGASNFPLAFSTAGGDTASALAAGCPVIVKAHPAHPGTNEIISSAIIRAAHKTRMPEGVFSSIHLSDDRVKSLVQHPTVKAVGFTGSRKVGMMLFHAGMQRKEPIPVYAEMSAINPVIILEDALKDKAAQIAGGLIASMTAGAGQFCTNPGLILLKDDTATKHFLERISAGISISVPGTMLNHNIYQAYTRSIHAMRQEKGIGILAQASAEANDEKNEAQPVALITSAWHFLENARLSQEIFGPASLIVLYTSTEELFSILESMEGQLTATLHAGTSEHVLSNQIVRIISKKAGRIVFGGFPTGVEVCDSMQHGGPFPSTSDGRSTSVGGAAIYRFLRPVAYQNLPDQFLPEPLQNSNPLNIRRLVNGEWTKKQLSNINLK
ncbi:MAG: aldehyde dehydrogenase (NADP(+)) [Chitinophagales bacterium]